MKYSFLVSVFAIGILISGCTTTKELLDKYESQLRAGKFDEAIELAEKQVQSNDEPLLWNLMAGDAASMADAKEKSIMFFDNAEDIFMENDANSVFSQGADSGIAMVTNDKAFPYNGIGQDRIFCCFYKAISYSIMGKIDAARTELNRAAQHQDNWLFERKKDILAASERLEKDAANSFKKDNIPNQDYGNQINSLATNDEFASQIKQKCNFDLATSGNLERLSEKDYVNAYIEHFCGIFRWLNDDGGRNFIRDASSYKPENQIVQQDLAMIDNGTKPKDMVWIYIEDGLCPCREEWSLHLPILLIPYANKYVLYAGMALPYLRYRDPASSSYTVTIPGQAPMLIPELENIDRLIKTEYDVYMRGAIPREVTRTLVKIASQVALGIAAENSKHDQRFALQLAQAGAAAWAASVTSADLRSWTSLPKAVYMQRIQRPQDGTILIQAAGKNVPILLPEGNSIVWIRNVSVLAPLVAKTMTFK